MTKKGRTKKLVLYDDRHLLAGIAAIRFKQFDSWDRFELHYGKECVYAWRETDRMGPELAYFIGMELMPLLRGLAWRIEGIQPSSKFKRPPIVKEIILEELAKVRSMKTGPRPEDLADVVWGKADAELKRRARIPGSLPERLERAPKVNLPNVHKVLREAGFALPRRRPET